ncbi:CapA family protein [Priestia koreensis]|uniref:CapA family protein n=1 Tax=Priestia koreensis TaxID=284581 RepID=UPI00345784AE
MERSTRNDMKRKKRETKHKRIFIGFLTILVALIVITVVYSVQSTSKPAAGEQSSKPVKQQPTKQSTIVKKPKPSQPTPHDPITFAFTGDVLLDKDVGQAIDQYGVDYPFQQVAPILQKADIAAINLETSVSTRGNPAGKQFTFRAKPKTLQGVKNAGVDVVTLANNHTLDYGVDALEDTITNLDEQKIGHTGAGMDEKEAFSAHYIKKNGKTIAILGLSHVLPEGSWFAKPDQPGIAEAYNTEPMMSYVKKAVKKADYTIVMIHWNRELADYPQEYARTLGKQFIDAGVSAVIGSHSHCLMGAELYKGSPIYYSLGNFVFTKSSVAKGRETMIVNMTIDNGKVTSSVVPANISNGQPRLQDQAYNQYIFQKLSRLSYNAHFSTDGELLPASKN